MMRSLLRPYEKRSWAQSNWILVRVWKGSGFAFRYTRSPHVTSLSFPIHPQGDGDLLNQTNHFNDPFPSLVFQEEIKETLLEDHTLATAFINGVLVQLNWAFSEFIGMVQEIHNASQREQATIYINNRQLKICAICFDMAVALLRVIELILK